MLNRRAFLATGGLAATGTMAGRAVAAEPARQRLAGATLDTEVLVCGGGCAGLGAALSAARNGARTLLIERAGFAGGIITTVGLPYFDGIAHGGAGPGDTGGDGRHCGAQEIACPRGWSLAGFFGLAL